MTKDVNNRIYGKIDIPVLLLLFSFLLSSASSGFCDDAALSAIFKGRDVTGTLVITNLEGTETSLVFCPEHGHHQTERSPLQAGNHHGSVQGEGNSGLSELMVHC
ncbi:MAG: hypothetical protein R2940_15440 [Syntrophotaleaceae bacterium]